ncbi:MAG: rhomboid family intramembrane serine protease [FCB group bacterium]|nr:rhomboid family intramembrane serine protease [FCB group bacterium]
MPDCPGCGTNLVHILVNPESTIPCIGASGGISGIIAFYTLKFPTTKINLLLYFGIIFRWVQLPVYVFFMSWLFWQGLGLYAQLGGFSNISSAAHLGGASVGVLYWMLIRD